MSTEFHDDSHQDKVRNLLRAAALSGALAVGATFTGAVIYTVHEASQVSGGTPEMADSIYEDLFDQPRP